MNLPGLCFNLLRQVKPKRMTIVFRKFSVDKKTLLIMKFSAILLFAACLQVSANGFSQKVTLSMKDASLQKVFKEINRQTGFQFFYNDALLNKAEKVNINVKNVTVNEALSQCFNHTVLDFTIVNNTILIKEITAKTEVKDPVVLAEPVPIEIKGRVVNDKGEPVEGVTVTVKGTRYATKTNANGEYTLSSAEINEKSILVFTAIGHETKEFTAGSKTVLNVELVVKVQAMDETVVVAYGTQKIKDVTGSISHLGTEAIKNAPMNSSIASLLQGKASGVNVVIQSASPTAPVSVIVRGASSLTGDNQPLWVIDGVPNYAESSTVFRLSSNVIRPSSDQSRTTTGDISNALFNLNLTDVESIDILKDASATALYGSRAANGVIIVTTKRGRTGNMPPVIELSSRLGYLHQNYNDFKYMNASEYKFVADKGAREAVFTTGSFDTYTRTYLDELAFMNLNTSEYNRNTFKILDSGYADGNTDWLKEMSQNPINQQYDLTIRGGANNLSYYVSLFRTNAQGIIKTGSSVTNGGRVNIEAKLAKSLKFGLNLSGSFRETNDKDYIMSVLHYVRPDIPPFNADGSIFTRDYYTENPYTTLRNTQRGKSQSFTGTSFLEVTPINGMILRSSYTITSRDNNYLTYFRQGSAYFNEANKSLDEDKYVTNVWENTLSYAKYVGRHDFLGLVGFSTENYSQLHFGMSGSGFPDDDVLNDFGSAAVIGALEESFTENALVSSFARLTYKYNKKYILSGTIRRDGSSRFGPDKRWGIFPSAAAAWLISEEKFMQTGQLSKIFSYLKLRGSAGRTGSQNLGNYDWRTGVSGTVYNNLPAIIPSSLGNPNLRWEETLMLDLGLDFGLLKDKITGTFGLYEKRTKDLIYSTPVPPSSSFSSISSNVAGMSNKGIEFDIKGQVIKRKDLTGTLDFNISRNISRVTRFNDQVKALDLPGTSTRRMRIEIGGRTGQWFGYKTANRLFVTQEEIIALQSQTTTGARQFYRTGTEAPGDLYFMDLNGDGVITVDDQTYLGSAEPKFTGGFGGTVVYKNFYANATFSYAYGHTRLWSLPMNSFASNNNNQSNLIAGQSATILSPYETTIPRVTPGGSGSNSTFSDYFLFDASYVRLSSLNLTYRIKGKILSNILQGLDITFQATNLITITKYPGFDPQGNWSNSRFGTGMGVDNSKYPNAKNFNLGFKFTFK